MISSAPITESCHQLVHRATDRSQTTHLRLSGSPASRSPPAVDVEADSGDVDVDVATDATSPRRITAYSDNGAVTVTRSSAC